MFQSSSCCGRAVEGKWWLLIKWLSNCVLPLAYCSRFIHVDVDWAQCIVRFGSAFVREIYRKIWWSMFCKNCGVYAYGGGRVVESKYKRPACPFNVHFFSLSFKTGVAACDDSHTATWGGGLAHILSLPSCISGGTSVNTCEKVAVKSDPLRESVEAYLFKLRLGLETKTCRPHRRGHEALQKSWIETCYRILL